MTRCCHTTLVRLLRVIVRKVLVAGGVDWRSVGLTVVVVGMVVVAAVGLTVVVKLLVPRPPAQQPTQPARTVAVSAVTVSRTDGVIASGHVRAGVGVAGVGGECGGSQQGHRGCAGIPAAAFFPTTVLWMAIWVTAAGSGERV